VSLGRCTGCEVLSLKAELLSGTDGLKLYCKKCDRITLSRLRCLFGEELFLTPLVCREAEVGFCVVLLEISGAEEHCCCILQLSSNTTGIEGKLSSCQDDLFQFVTFPRYMLFPSAKWSFQALGSNAFVQREARVGLDWQFSSLLWSLVYVWTWPLSFCISTLLKLMLK